MLIHIQAGEGEGNPSYATSDGSETWMTAAIH